MGFVSLVVMLLDGGLIAIWFSWEWQVAAACFVWFCTRCLVWNFSFGFWGLLFGVVGGLVLWFCELDDEGAYYSFRALLVSVVIVFRVLFGILNSRCWALVVMFELVGCAVGVVGGCGMVWF